MKKEIQNRELLRLQLDIMDKIHEFCINQNIKYFLFAGSLLGAVRHKGYIPWDDDIDIAMPRSDYNKFIQTFNGTYSYLNVLAPELDIKYYATYANVIDNRTILDEGCNGHNGFSLGIKIDVFPIDGVAADEEKYLKDKHKIAFLNNICYIKRYRLNNGGGFIKDIKFFIYKIICLFYNSTKLRMEVLKIANNYSENTSLYYDDIVQNYDKNTRFSAEAIKRRKLVVFEKRLYYIPEGYDQILQALYGDYMILPPVEKRIPHHGFKAFWK